MYRSSCANVTVSVLTTNCISSHWYHDHYSDELTFSACFIVLDIVEGSFWLVVCNDVREVISSTSGSHLTCYLVLCHLQLVEVGAVVYWRSPAAMRQHLAALNDMLVHRQIRVHQSTSQCH